MGHDNALSPTTYLPVWRLASPAKDPGGQDHLAQVSCPI